jgi:hypothetical protein
MTNEEVMEIHVTATNHAWAAEMSGLPIAEVERRFQAAEKEDIVCVIKTGH